MTEETVLATPLAETDPTTKIEMPNAELAKEPAVEPKAEEPKANDGAEDLTTESETGERKNVPGSQRLKRRLELVQSDLNNLLNENQELKRRLETPATEKRDGKPGIDREPTEADFPNDYFAYERAKTAWDVRQSIRDEIRGQINQDRNSKAEQQRAEHHRERLMVYEDNATEARERIPDFDKVVRSATDVTLKQEVVEELLASDKSALLQYHLAKNPDKARDLNGMSGKELAREIGRLESRVHLPTPKKATEATPPPKEIKGGAAQEPDAKAGPDDMNAYVAWRKKQGAA